MAFTLNKQLLQDASHALFYMEEEAFSGVNKIAHKVMNDVSLVFGEAPKATTDFQKLSQYAIIYGTVGRSSIIEQLAEKKVIDLTPIKDKSEVFLAQVIHHPFAGVERAYVIAGSDKRGTIYGLFHLSEMLGVSPLVNWANVSPQPKDSFIIKDDYKHISKEPSVRYRGFFINDEWPAFGTWATQNYGGFNAKVYDLVFELLLRLKGNYLWPAMWSARFYDDGPGLANAELADEYGVVMGASHHEPCLRYGEEYKYLRGKNSIYGDAWNFTSNREGITRFWEDGLKRSGKFESVVTVGMRGEADTAIMGKDATLADNIQLLREVLQTQNRLISEHVNENLSEVPRMLALYKEVEPFFYGDEHTSGLIDSKELEDVILMLCDDNHGNLRTLPTKDMRNHKGGYGMYYHFDYHGGPISYEWVNSSYLPKIWEQMTMAYDFGVRDLWIVNVGDISTQEFPLSYFLDMAYDFDKWGTNAINKTDEYTKLWIEKQFAEKLTHEEIKQVYELIIGYTKMAHIRRPEHMNVNIYHPENYKETELLLQKIERLLDAANTLYKTIDKRCFNTYFTLVYYPVVANLNVQKMWLLAGKNQYDAKLGLLETNRLADKIKACVELDRAIVEDFHKIDNGKWYGMGLSEHIGFTKWNEDEAQYPVLMTVIAANKARLLVSIDGTTQRSEGSPWHINQLYLDDFLNPDVEEASFTIFALSKHRAPFTITTHQAWLSCSVAKGELDGQQTLKQRIIVKLDRGLLTGKTAVGQIDVELPLGKCTIIVNINQNRFMHLPQNTFVETNDYISIEAEHFATSQPSELGEFKVIEGYGKTLSAIKAFPTDQYFTAGLDAPYVEYLFETKGSGDYVVELYMQPSNPVTQEGRLHCGLQINNEPIEVINTLPEGYRVDDGHWAIGVLNHIRILSTNITCQEGVNTLKVFAVTPGFVLEKLVIYAKGKKLAESYLGPAETYYVRK